MRKIGISDIFYSIFFADLTFLMFIGIFTLISNTYGRALFAGVVNGKNIFISNAFYYFYYPPKGQFAFLLPIPFWAGVAILLFLYILIFAYDWNGERTHRGRNPLETPIGFIIGAGSLLYLISIVLVLIQDLLGAPITSSFITQDEKLYPNLLYYELIYAPFVEEIEFRILPIGIYLFARYKLSKVNFRWYEVFLFPGRIMKRAGRKLDKADWAVIIITSMLFGYAHYDYGGWSISKIPQAAIAGVVLAMGFMLFGPFVDIPIHFLFDGAFTVTFLPNVNPIGVGLAFLGIILIFGAAIVTIILMALIYIRKRSGIADRSFLEG